MKMAIFFSLDISSYAPVEFKFLTTFLIILFLFVVGNLQFRTTIPYVFNRWTVAVLLSNSVKNYTQSCFYTISVFDVPKLKKYNMIETLLRRLTIHLLV